MQENINNTEEGLAGEPTAPRVLRLSELRYPVYAVMLDGKPLGVCDCSVCHNALSLYSTPTNAQAAIDTAGTTATVETLATRTAVVELIKRAQAIGWRFVELDPTADVTGATAEIGCLLQEEAV